MDTGLLRIETEKTGTVVVLPMHSDFAQRLAGRPRGIGKAPVFPELAGKRISGGHGLSAQFRAIVEAAGITGRVVTREGKGRATNSKTFHVLRHCFISSLQTRAHPTSGRSSPVMMTQKTTPTRRTTNCKRCVARLSSCRGLNERWSSQNVEPDSIPVNRFHSWRTEYPIPDLRRT